MSQDEPCTKEHRAWIDEQTKMSPVIPADPVTDFITLTNTDLNKLVVSIKFDGTVELGPGVTVDEAAKEFYDRVSQYALEHGLAKESSAAEHALDAIAKICGCPEWDYPGQLVRDVQTLKNRVDKAAQSATEFAARYVELEDKLDHLAHRAGPSSCADFAKRCHEAEKEYRAKLAEMEGPK